MEKKYSDIFSQRLRQARKMRGLSLEALSKSLPHAISRQAINKYEQGKMMPDSRTLIFLASSLGVKVDFFFRPFTVSVEGVEFRKKSKFTERQSESVKELVRETLERYLEIEQLGGNAVKFDIKRSEVSSIDEAKALAKEVRAILQLGSDGISNVVEVLEDHGIKVIEIDESDAFDGLCGFANGNIPVIVINSNFAPERKRFTAMHELGHLLMILPESSGHKETEYICNAFASELLLPEEILIAKIGERRHDISLSELIDIQRQFGISIDAIMYSLCLHGVISEQRYKTYNIKKNTMSEFKEEVIRSRVSDERSGRFFRMVYRALADEIISISKAAALLNTSVDRIQSQLQLV